MVVGPATLRINYEWQEACRCGPYGPDNPRALTPAQKRRIRKRRNKARGFTLSIYDECVVEEPKKG